MSTAWHEHSVFPLRIKPHPPAPSLHASALEKVVRAPQAAALEYAGNPGQGVDQQRYPQGFLTASFLGLICVGQEWVGGVYFFRGKV